MLVKVILIVSMTAAVILLATQCVLLILVIMGTVLHMLAMYAVMEVVTTVQQGYVPIHNQVYIYFGFFSYQNYLGNICF